MEETRQYPALAVTAAMSQPSNDAAPLRLHIGGEYSAFGLLDGPNGLTIGGAPVSLNVVATKTA